MGLESRDATVWRHSWMFQFPSAGWDEHQASRILFSPERKLISGQHFFRRNSLMPDLTWSWYYCHYIFRKNFTGDHNNSPHGAMCFSTSPARNPKRFLQNFATRFIPMQPDVTLFSTWLQGPALTQFLGPRFSRGQGSTQKPPRSPEGNFRGFPPNRWFDPRNHLKSNDPYFANMLRTVSHKESTGPCIVSYVFLNIYIYTYLFRYIYIYVYIYTYIYMYHISITWLYIVYSLSYQILLMTYDHIFFLLNRQLHTPSVFLLLSFACLKKPPYQSLVAWELSNFINSPTNGSIHLSTSQLVTTGAGLQGVEITRLLGNP